MVVFCVFTMAVVYNNNLNKSIIKIIAINLAKNKKLNVGAVLDW